MSVRIKVARRGAASVIAAALTLALVSCAPPGPVLSVTMPGRAPVLDGLIPTPSPLPAGDPGSIVVDQALPANPVLPGVTAHRILYRSTDASGQTIAVSGYVVVPAGPAPAGGWPVMSWGHGTSGVSDACAPSRSPQNRLYGTWSYDNAVGLLDAGVMIVATDYPGLGTDGPHPYLDGAADGRSMIDAARAATAFGGSRTTVFEGFSQGGQAALFAGRLAPTYAPELDVRGVVAVAPASHLAFAKAVLPTTGLDFSYPGLIAYGRLVSDRKLNAGDLLQPSGIAKLSNIDDTVCSTPALDAADFRADFLQLPDWRDSFAGNEPGTARIASDVLLIQGVADRSVPQIASELLCNGFGTNGTHATLWTYDGADHVPSMYLSQAEREQWILARFGTPPTETGPPASVHTRRC